MMPRHTPKGSPCEDCGEPARMHRPPHAPKGFPWCETCGAPSKNHRPEHAPDGNPCKVCLLPASSHKVRTQRKRKPDPNRKYAKDSYWGLDGEGQGRDKHRYTMLAAVDETGKKTRCIEAESLSTIQCLEFILSLPKLCKVFAYSFNYDLTLMLKDLDNKSLYLLFHEELRQRPPKTRLLGPRPVVWNGYILNLQRTKFSVQKGKDKRIIWDIWRFFQGKFVNSLEAWGIGSKDELKAMANMKDQRADFDKLDSESVKAYCFDECQKLAQLARKLVNAHDEAGLHLTNFYGAGSSASAMLKLMSIQELKVKESDEMKEAVASAFFGGRFENAIIGSFPGPVYSYDISSAYPYQLTFLPCLLHGQWSRIRDADRMRRARTAIVRYKLVSGYSQYSPSWAPFPFREESGNICFPIMSGGGWVWKDEYLAGERLFPHVRFDEAWVYECDCDCQPFKRIPEWYRERVKLGKEAAGIVLKLGMNSCYGKLAQSIGIDPPYQCWIWAGMITSGCRAQILEMLGRLSAHDQLLMVATDGIYTRERITNLPIPRDTGTGDLPKPLGGWEEKIVNSGVFAARPGIYFPLAPTDEQLKEVRARGIGKATLLQCWQQIQEAWEAGHSTTIVGNVTRFCGAKSSLSVRGAGTQHLQFMRAPSYGQWVPRPIELSFSPLPKRSKVCEDGISLALREVVGTSTPYNRAIHGNTVEAIMLRLAELEASEQPDGGDLIEYD
jgi:hypothetical protein